MKRLIPFLCLSCLGVSSLSAQETVSEVDVPAETETSAEADDPVSPPSASVFDEAVIPHAYEAGRYQNTWDSNPFLRKTVVIAGPKVDWSNDWALAGMYKSTTGKINISLQNKQTGDYKRVSSEDGADSEFRLVKANFNRNRNEASVEIAKGNETATLKYDDNLTSRPVTVNNTFKVSPANTAGNPNVRPGQPVNATPPTGVQPGVPPTITRPGIAPGPATNNQPSPASPPTISRRRQLIPAPVAPPAQQQ